MMTIRCESCGEKKQIKERLEVRFMFCECGGEYYEYEDLPCDYYPDEDIQDE